jgi:hypothetical protein
LPDALPVNLGALRLEVWVFYKFWFKYISHQMPCRATRSE